MKILFDRSPIRERLDDLAWCGIRIGAEEELAATLFFHNHHANHSVGRPISGHKRLDGFGDRLTVNETLDRLPAQAMCGATRQMHSLGAVLARPASSALLGTKLPAVLGRNLGDVLGPHVQQPHQRQADGVPPRMTQYQRDGHPDVSVQKLLIGRTGRRIVVNAGTFDVRPVPLGRLPDYTSASQAVNLTVSASPLVPLTASTWSTTRRVRRFGTL